MRKWRLDQKGVTLIELLAALVLLSLILSLAVSAYNFGMNSFHRTTQRSELQDNVRLISHTITSELRYANEVKLLDSCPSSADLMEGYSYICLSSDGASIDQMQYAGGTHETSSIVAANQKDSVTYDLEFKIDSSNSSLLSYTIESRTGNQTFHVETKLSLLNMELLESGAITSVGSEPYRAIEFTYKEALDGTG